VTGGTGETVGVTVTLNGEARTLAAGTTVADLVADLAGDRRGVAVAVNDEVVPRSEWDEHVVAPGDRVEVLKAVQGGC
jgi:sulfur carrier protein